MATLVNKTTFAGIRLIGKTVGYSNIYGLIMGLGYNALGCDVFSSSSRGTFIGVNSGLRICTSSTSIAIGADSLCSSTNLCCINQSTLIGACIAAGRNNLCNVVGVGFHVLNQNSSCNVDRTVIIGANQTGRYSNGISSDNTIIGSYSSKNLPNSKNLLIGYQVARSLSAGIDSNNVLIGYRAGRNLGSDSFNNIHIGSRAGEGMSGNYFETVVIGYNSIVSASYHTVIGNANTTNRNSAPTNWTIISDYRDKSNISELEENLGLNFIRKLKPISYKSDHRKRYVDQLGFEYGEKDGSLKDSNESYGFSAQDIKETIEELSVTFDALGHDNINDAYRLAYAGLIAPIVKSLQETLLRLERVEKLIEEDGMF